MKKFFFSMLLIVGLVFPSYMSMAQPTSLTEEEQYAEDRIEELSEIIRRVLDNYYFEDKADIDEMIDDAIESVLDSIEDQHSMYVPSHKREQFEQEFYGEDSAGIGIRFAPYPEYSRIINVYNNTPAMEAGLQREDAITHVDGERVRGYPIQRVSELLSGPANSDVSVTVDRNGTSITFNLTRLMLEYQSVFSSALPNDIAYIRITDFIDRTAEDFYFHSMRMSLLIDDPKGLIIDLRYNLGGLMNEALMITDMILSEGVMMYSQRRDTRDRAYHAVERTVLPTDLPIVVLINGKSASASEIVAGALQDNGRATLIGVQSFGKGSIQTIFYMGEHGSILKITTGLYLLPSGISIDSVGVGPDVVVEQPIDTSIDQRYILSEAVSVSYSLDPSLDAQLNEAMQYLIEN